MDNKHDEIKNLLKASRIMLSNNKINESIDEIRNIYGIITEQGINLTSGDVTDKINPTKSTEEKIEDDTEPSKDKTQGYRISGGILVLHGKDKRDLELTTDDKISFQETMDEFVNEVAELVDFNKLNVYPNNVEWSGKIIDFDLEFFFSIGEESGIYINGDMIRTDDKFLEMINKLKKYYEKFKSKWSKVLAQRKKTKN
jgi:Asp-tRNA(Asn)/Glu-tRNA(Gln) amidotransferase C subunit